MITSVHNPLVKEIAALREPKARKETGLAVIDGAREIQSALAAGIKIEKVIYCKNSGTCTHSVRVPEFGCSQIEVNAKVFEKIAYGQRNDGVIAVAQVSLKQPGDLKLSANPLVVVIESVEKPGNLGAVLRTCDGAGVEALFICDPKTDLFNPNVIRASMGTVFTVPVAMSTSEDIRTFLKQKGIKVLGTFPQAKDMYSLANLKGPLAIVLGAEDQGLGPFWQKHCDLKVKIPMNGLADSLNVSVSAAIIVYESLRQRT
ncbi:MAG: RNA methyltransferase [Candidatus Omnitrophica bacterium]|nr:RNA methyltransferase [Candidatus Omnitrophota bacterium]